MSKTDLLVSVILAMFLGFVVGFTLGVAPHSAYCPKLYVKSDLEFAESETESALIQKILRPTDNPKEWLVVHYGR